MFGAAFLAGKSVVSDLADERLHEGVLTSLRRPGVVFELEQLQLEEPAQLTLQLLGGRVTQQRQSRQRERLAKEKFQGVLEMAGGVAHSLNQPLTIINNLINEVLGELQQDKETYLKIVKVHNQIKKMNDITDKLGRIKKYEAMDYVAGIKIVDIDKASWSRDKEEDR